MAGSAHVRRFAWGYAVLGLLGGILPGILFLTLFLRSLHASLGFLGFLNGPLPETLAGPILVVAAAIYYLSLPAAAWLVGRSGWQGIGWTANGYVIGVIVTTGVLILLLLGITAVPL